MFQPDNVPKIPAQPRNKVVPIERNVLLKTLETNLSSGRHTLRSFMDGWLETDHEGCRLQQCSCFSRVIAQFELEVAVSLTLSSRSIFGVENGEMRNSERNLCAQSCFQANNLRSAEKILLFVKKIIYGEFKPPHGTCSERCRKLLIARERSVPRVSIIISRLYLIMCLNKGPHVQDVLEEEPFIGR